MKHSALHYSTVAALVLLSACQSYTPPSGVKVGKPYSVAGKMYYPEYDPTYDEEGIASWYGPGFHGGRTANGEKFDTHDLTAAHPTLPMPSIVRVTNLQNGKALIVRINDRGPFAESRIIDLSRESAQRLGISGLAKVRVQYLQKESEEYIAAMNEGRRMDMFAFNSQAENDKRATILASTAPADQSIIVESTDSRTEPGAAVVGAAPVISVSNVDLPSPSQKPSGGGVLIREAHAEEDMENTPVGKRGGEVILQSASLDVQTKSYEPVNAPEFNPPAKKKEVAKTVPASPKGSYFIQVGSFSQPDNASTMEDKIAPIAPATTTMVDMNGITWWRVKSGPFATEADASDALEQIREVGAADARIMRQ